MSKDGLHLRQRDLPLVELHARHLSHKTDGRRRHTGRVHERGLEAHAIVFGGYRTNRQQRVRELPTDRGAGISRQCLDLGKRQAVGIVVQAQQRLGGTNHMRSDYSRLPGYHADQSRHAGVTMVGKVRQQDRQIETRRR
ncbi:hypothetical protein [Gemmatimonas sp.]|uniref:hypothetical protein n=1 Tax=Gemmatimonas sp. TaxID=1962908 RepID=UPI0022C0E580|nr:hypothetical protein [Gemmatimonas sp.]MCZ8013852.1 hypothetical protein [Gemmatimonas sp.]MCZ8268100.1 hypothetical protein [Gemmatimonas sp.]